MQVRELTTEEIERLAEIFANPDKKVIGISINKDLDDEVAWVVQYTKGKSTQSAIF